jgi:hypothetical protein
MLAGDEVYGDEVTSGVEEDACADCGGSLAPEDGDPGVCRDCAAELGEAGG